MVTICRWQLKPELALKFYLTSYFLGGKLLVYGGTVNKEYANGPFQDNTAEVLDLLNEDVECDMYFNGHNTSVMGASGGRIDDEFVYCGGTMHSMNSSDLSHMCRILGKGYPGDPWHAPLKIYFHVSSANGGVILPNNTLFIAGE